jgi:hypothetical protein
VKNEGAINEARSLLPFTTTRVQDEVLQAIIQSNGNKAAAARLRGTDERGLKRTYKRIKEQAAKRHYAPENSINNPLPKGMETRGVSQLVNEETGTPVMTWYKSKPEKESLEELTSQAIEAMLDELPKFTKTAAPRNTNKELLNDIVIGDPHLDMLAYDKETGKNWDIKIAEEQHMRGVLALLKRAPAADIGRLTILGDTLHRDSLKALTPGSGNLVDVDGRLGRSYYIAIRLFRFMIEEMLKTHKKVVVSFVRGNHSETLELTLRACLFFVYEKNKRVEVLDNTSRYIPYSFYDNFLLDLHGDKLNEQKKANIATGMFKELHGNAKFTHIKSGHIHHSTQKEISSCLVETFQALPTPDAWHVESGFASSDQSISLLTYHKLGGIVSRLTEYPRIFMR